MKTATDRSTVTCTRVDPELLRRGGPELTKAIKKAPSDAVKQEVFTQRAEERREAERARHRARFKKS